MSHAFRVRLSAHCPKALRFSQSPKALPTDGPKPESLDPEDVQTRAVGSSRVQLRHRRSRRHPAAAFARFTPPLGQGPCSGDRAWFREAETALLYWFAIVDGCCRVAPLLAPPITNQAHSLSHWYHFTPASGDPSSLWPKPWARRISTNAWTDTNAVFGLKNSKFQGLAARFFACLCSEDKLRLRRDPTFDKGRKDELSTFRRIDCGQRWTTQRPIDLRAIRAQPKTVSVLSGSSQCKAKLRKNCATRPSESGSLLLSRAIAAS